MIRKYQWQRASKEYKLLPHQSRYPATIAILYLTKGNIPSSISQKRSKWPDTEISKYYDQITNTTTSKHACKMLKTLDPPMQPLTLQDLWLCLRKQTQGSFGMQ